MNIDGNLIKEHIKNQCKEYQQELQGKEITIIRFEVPSRLTRDNLTEKQKVLKGKYEAALVSENQKLATFESFGVRVNRETLLPETTTVEQFREIIQAINDNEAIRAAIVQFPIPPEFEDSIQFLSSEKDIDCVRREPNNLFSAPATSEGVARIVESYAQPGDNVAIIGGGGFIGVGVANYFQEKGINYFVLEQNDDLLRTSEADIVVSVTGVAGLVTPYILPQHRLVVDSGFTPGETRQDLPRGDVDRSAYNIPQNITPVPGGIGPTEMAILAERFIKMELGIELPKWNYQDLQREQTEKAQVIYPIVRDYFENQKATNPQAITQPKSNIEQLTGQQYKITKENQTNILSLNRTSDNVNLIKANLSTNEITINRGLTEGDVNNFQQIQQVQHSTKIYKASYGLFSAMKGYGRTTEVSPGVETVNAGQYILKLDNNENTFSVSAQDGRGKIVKFNFNNYQIETAQNITENDIDNWKQINQALNYKNILNIFSPKDLEI